MQKSVGHCVVVSATFACLNDPLAREILTTQAQYLEGSGMRKYWYHQLQRVINMLVPVRCRIHRLLA
jgi:hypothetical protein